MKTKNYTYNEKNEKRRRENRDCMRKVKIKRGIFRHPPWWPAFHQVYKSYWGIIGFYVSM